MNCVCWWKDSFSCCHILNERTHDAFTGCSSAPYVEVSVPIPVIHALRVVIIYEDSFTWKWWQRCSVSLSTKWNDDIVALSSGETRLTVDGRDRNGIQHLNKLSDGKWHRIDVIQHRKVSKSVVGDNVRIMIVELLLLFVVLEMTFERLVNFHCYAFLMSC